MSEWWYLGKAFKIDILGPSNIQNWSFCNSRTFIFYWFLFHFFSKLSRNQNLSLKTLFSKNWPLRSRSWSFWHLFSSKWHICQSSVLLPWLSYTTIVQKHCLMIFITRLSTVSKNLIIPKWHLCLEIWYFKLDRKSLKIIYRKLKKDPHPSDSKKRLSFGRRKGSTRVKLLLLLLLTSTDLSVKGAVCIHAH